MTLAFGIAVIVFGIVFLGTLKYTEKSEEPFGDMLKMALIIALWFSIGAFLVII